MYRILQEGGDDYNFSVSYIILLLHVPYPSPVAGRKCRGNWFFSCRSHRILPYDSRSNLCTFDFDVDATGQHTCVKRNNARSVFPRESLLCFVYDMRTHLYISWKLNLYHNIIQTHHNARTITSIQYYIRCVWWCRPHG